MSPRHLSQNGLNEMDYHLPHIVGEINLGILILRAKEQIKLTKRKATMSMESINGING